MFVKCLKPLVIGICFAALWVGGLAVPGWQAESAPPRQDAQAAHMILSATDEAQLRRADWTGFSGVSVGTMLEFGDLLDPGGQPLRVLCADLSEQTVTVLGPVPCANDRPVLVQGDQAVAGWQRGAVEDVFLPFLILPRATYVVADRITIRWNPVIDADSYRVTVSGPDVNWTHDVVDGAAHSLTYPPDAPALAANTPYTVEVVALMGGVAIGSSADEDAPGLSFRVLPGDAAAEIKALATDIQTQLTDPDGVTLALATLYEQSDLLSDAIATLETVAGDLMLARLEPTSPLGSSPVLYLRLGDLYLETQLEYYATLAYTEALTLAEQSADMESVARAAEALARLSVDSSDTQRFAKQAVDVWLTLGDTGRSADLMQEFDLDP